MSITALSSSSATNALSFLSRLSSANSISSNNSAGGAEGVRPPPPPPQDGGGFADAIAEALKSIGVTDTSSGSGTDTSAATASTDSTASTTTDATDVAAALGSFMQSLMGALHAQNTGNDAPPPYSEQQAGGQGGPGRLESDLQSLISKLSPDTADSGSSDAVDQLESSFANLLDKLGVSTTDASAGTDATSTDSSSGAADKLTAFLQALSSKVGNHGSSGNLVNTTV